jgi:hypothetical protein
MSEPPDRSRPERAVEQLVRSVTSAIVLAAGELPWCEQRPPDDGFGYWCSLRPDVIMCAFCFGAAQAMAAAEEFRCSACGGPAPDKDRDVSVAARLEDWLGVYFFLCRRCCAADAAG